MSPIGVDATPRTFGDSILGAFKAFWETKFPDVATRPPVAYPNTKLDPADPADVPPGLPYVRVFLALGPEPDVRHGSDVFQRSGSITLSLFVRGGTRTNELTLLEDAAREFLEEARASIRDGWTRNIRGADVGADGAYYQRDLTADWTYFTSRAA